MSYSFVSVEYISIKTTLSYSGYRIFYHWYIVEIGILKRKLVITTAPYFGSFFNPQ